MKRDLKLRPLAIALAVIALLLVAACGGTGEACPTPASRRTTRAGPFRHRRRASPPSRAGPHSAPTGNRAPTPPGSRTPRRPDLDVRPGRGHRFVHLSRRTLQEGTLPEPGQIRPEEFVNAFRQDYAQPADDGFTVNVDGARMPSRNQAVLRVGLQTRGSDAAARRPANLTFVVDVSGSMAEPGRLDLVKRGPAHADRPARAG